MTDRLTAALEHGPLLLDAAMGTRLIAQGLRLEGDDPVFWNLTHPEAVAAVHRRDVAAGSDILLTNTFGANSVWLERFDRAREVATINRQAVALARQEAGPDRFVVGSIGPTAATTPRASRAQAEILVEAEVDGLILETHQLDQAVIALKQVAPHIRVPLWVSLFHWPEPADAVVEQLAALGATAVGLNCVVGMEPAVRIATALRRASRLPLIVKPSAGFPGAPQASPKSFARESVPLLALAPIAVGGCCGTDDSHVAALRAAWYDEHHH